MASRAIREPVVLFTIQSPSDIELLRKMLTTKVIKNHHVMAPANTDATLTRLSLWPLVS